MVGNLARLELQRQATPRKGGRLRIGAGQELLPALVELFHPRKLSRTGLQCSMAAITGQDIIFHLRTASTSAGSLECSKFKHRKDASNGAGHKNV